MVGESLGRCSLKKGGERPSLSALFLALELYSLREESRREEISSLLRLGVGWVEGDGCRSKRDGGGGKRRFEVASFLPTSLRRSKLVEFG